MITVFGKQMSSLSTKLHLIGGLSAGSFICDNHIQLSMLSRVVKLNEVETHFIELGLGVHLHWPVSISYITLARGSEQFISGNKWASYYYSVTGSGRSHDVECFAAGFSDITDAMAFRLSIDVPEEPMVYYLVD